MIKIFFIFFFMSLNLKLVLASYKAPSLRVIIYINDRQESLKFFVMSEAGGLRELDKNINVGSDSFAKNLFRAVTYENFMGLLSRQISSDLTNEEKKPWANMDFYRTKLITRRNFRGKKITFSKNRKLSAKALQALVTKYDKTNLRKKRRKINKGITLGCFGFLRFFCSKF